MQPPCKRRNWVQLLAGAPLLLWATLAAAHDPQHTNLDAWYQSLMRPGTKPAVSCCNKTDCHTTEAEVRGPDWWARIGVPRGDGSWELLNWARVRPEVVIHGRDNPTGEAVICHDLNWSNGVFQAQATTVLCFVPPIQY